MLIRVICLTLFAGITTIARADKIDAGNLPGISGLAKLEDSVYLAVSDEKARQEPENEGPRTVILSLKDPEKPTFTVTDVDWSAFSDGRSNDLESICAIEGKPGEFIAVESGHYHSKYGRILHLNAEKNGDQWKISAIGAIFLPDQLPDGLACKDIEGAQTYIRDGETYLLLGYRGKDLWKGRLIWGKLNWKKPLFKVIADMKFYTPMQKMKLPGEKRYCSDLLLINGDIYAASCNDPGNDGPFTSIVYHLGHINPTGPMIHLVPNDQLEIARYEGHKIEALAPPLNDKGRWVAASDDENANGSIFITEKP